MDLKGGLIVSTQALENEPLHSSFIMRKMAKAAWIGGAKGIRANTPKDIKAIKQEVDLPIIGIYKKEYDGFDVFITPTYDEVKAIADSSASIVALDATNRKRPKEDLKTIVKQFRKDYPNKYLMADISTYDEALNAKALGFDYISTTLVGYTAYTNHQNIQDQDYALLKDLLSIKDIKLVAEGKIDSPEVAKKVLDLGCYFTVVGSAITRPQLITKKFVKTIES